MLPSAMLTFCEEILLLALDDDKGSLLSLPEEILDFAFAGAILMELAFNNRIDSDLTHLAVVDPAATGDPLLDDILDLCAKHDPISIEACLNRIADNAGEIRERTFGSLVEKNILKQKDERFLWVYKRRRYPVIDEKEPTDIRARIRDVALADAFPDPRDAVLIALMDACQLAGTIFTPEEMAVADKRIKLVAKLDLIGQAISKTIADIRRTIVDTLRFKKI